MLLFIKHKEDYKRGKKAVRTLAEKEKKKGAGIEALVCARRRLKRANGHD